MAIDVTRLPRPAASSLRVRTLSPALMLSVLVATSTVASALVAFARATPRYFPDEFLYSQFARSLAEGHRPGVLGEPSSFPALLEPLLASLARPPGDPELAFRLTQALHALVMSLAVVPVYLLARRLGLRPALGWFAALVAVLSPDLVYVGYSTADALGYTLALAAVAAGVTVLSVPNARGQAVFLALASAAVLARVQYALLLPAFAIASVLVERGSLRRALARFRLVHGALAAALIAGLALGPALAGPYATATGFRLSADAGLWVPRSGFLLVLACGVAIVPGAVAWLTYGRRSVTRARMSFAQLSVVLMSGLVAVAAVMTVDTGSERFFERYLMIAIPIVALAFGCWVEEGLPGRRLVLGTAVLLLAVASLLPVSAYAAGQGAADSPFLLGVRRLEEQVGVANASLVVAAAVSAALLAAAWSALGRRGPWVAAATTAAGLAIVSLGAHAEDLRLSRSVADRTLGDSPSWVDETGTRDVLLLQTANSPRDAAVGQAFWNASVTRGALLGERAVAMDGASDRVMVATDGLMLLQGRPLHGPLLLATAGTRVVPANGRVLRGAPGFELLEPAGAARLATLAEGLASDGWLAGRTTITVWRRGELRLRLSLPPGYRTTALELRGPGIRRMLLVEPGRQTLVRVTAPGRAPSRLELSTHRPFGLADGRLVAAKVTSLEFANRP